MQATNHGDVRTEVELTGKAQKSHVENNGASSAVVSLAGTSLIITAQV